MTDHAAASKRLPSGSRAGDPRERIPGWGTDRQEGGKVKATEKLHELGQSLWLDNITREMLDSGQLQTYIDDYSVTGLTSNPAIFDKAIASGGYDDAIHGLAETGKDREVIFFEITIDDLRRTAELIATIA